MLFRHFDIDDDKSINCYDNFITYQEKFIFFTFLPTLMYKTYVR